MPGPKVKGDQSVFPLGGSHVQPPQPSSTAPSMPQPQGYSIYDWFRELHDGQQRLEQRVKALEDENATLKRKVAELEEWREGMDVPEQPEGWPAKPILPPYEG